ncbi:MAG: FecR domain-containing protein, partial [Crocinitomicaceae bacterium]|nr:FecR domain-containing protein [Crocinitomicaceae bacterium]
MHSQHEHIHLLIQRYRSGLATQDEVRQLMTCLQSGEDTEYIEAIISEGLLDTDIPKAMATSPRMEKKMEDLFKQIKKKQNPTRSIRKYLTIAAAIISFAFLTLYIYKSFNLNTEEQRIADIQTDDISPGGNRATITLSDGTVIELAKDQQGIIASGTQLSYADGQKLLEADKDIQFATMTTPRGGQYQITLPDGTKAWLNAASSLRYPSRFNNNERKVTLEGEAYFEVAPDKEHPFIVESNGQSVEVLGTGFNVNAYRDERQSLTTLAHGSIRINTADESKSIILKPGEQAAVEGKEIKVKQVEVDEYTAWRNGKISLSQADLSGIIRQIERWY